MTQPNTEAQDKDTTLDDLLDHLVFKEGTGPNGSGGEIRYWKNDLDIPAKQALLQWRDKAVVEALETLEPPELENPAKSVSPKEESIFKNGERTMALKWKIAIKERTEQLKETPNED